jgi:hypothetical protein
VDQIPGLSNLPATFKGVLRLSSATPFSVVGLRFRTNERSEFLMTTVAPNPEQTPAGTQEMVFPHLVAGGGFSTQVILFSGSTNQSTNGNLRLMNSQGGAFNATVSVTEAPLP